MNRGTFSIVALALIGNLCISRIAAGTVSQKNFKRLNRAAIDIAMTCFGDPGDAVGVLGDTNGAILKELRSKSFIPVALVRNQTDELFGHCDTLVAHKLRVFIVAVHSPSHLFDLLYTLNKYVWWNSYANFVIADARPEPSMQCSLVDSYMIMTTMFGVLNAQFVCIYVEEDGEPIVIWNSNPFINWAPKEWTFAEKYRRDKRKDIPDGSLFVRLYREGRDFCRSINFPKTNNAGGYPLHFISDIPPRFLQRDVVIARMERDKTPPHMRAVLEWQFNEYRWLIDNIADALRVSVVLTNDTSQISSGIYLYSHFLSSQPEWNARRFDRMVVRKNQWPMFAVTQHTGHMTQLEKILTVIDSHSRIGMIIVYFITFLFFKFFLGQAVMPAILNLVRLTCGTGLTTLPQNVAPTIYLASLLMFVVTLQGIYTGNLATFLTTTISYPNVQTKTDIPKRGYTLYVNKDTNTKLTADPIFDGCLMEIPSGDECINYVLSDPLAACAMDHYDAIVAASQQKLHVSRDPITYDYWFYETTVPNLFKRRIEEVLDTLFESGVYRVDPKLEKLRLQFVDDEEVQKNTERRVMTLVDLNFAFIILGVGLLCSLVCFIGEIVVYKIQLKTTKRRDRVRVRSAWGACAKKLSFFSSLNCRLNLRQLFRNRR